VAYSLEILLLGEALRSIIGAGGRSSNWRRDREGGKVDMVGRFGVEIKVSYEYCACL
jgi:hypothetical protein